MMQRLQKKCLMASAATHALLLVIFLFGSAFFVPRKQPLDLPAVRVVPSKLVDALLSGGGGDPNIKPSQERIKGDTLEPQPAPPQPTPPKPAPTPQRAEPKPSPAKADPPKLVLRPTVRKNSASKPLDLKPRQSESPAKATKPESANPGKALAGEVSRMADSLRSGFKDGTAVNVSGPGGEAFANYAQWVKEVYENAWVVGDDLDDLQSTTKVSVTIARNGNVIASSIERRSGNSVLDESVERTLAKVKFVRPFPEGATDTERTFTINFNLKAKRAIG